MKKIIVRTIAICLVFNICSCSMLLTEQINPSFTPIEIGQAQVDELALAEQHKVYYFDLDSSAQIRITLYLLEQDFSFEVSDDQSGINILLAVDDFADNSDESGTVTLEPGLYYIAAINMSPVNALFSILVELV